MPAKAPGQSTSMSNVRPLSLASQLLQCIRYSREQLLGCEVAIAGRPAPTGNFCQARNLSTTRSTVGAGLPAKAPGQSTSMSNVRPLSLASQLLQCIRYSREQLLGCEVAIAGRPAPTGNFCQARNLSTTRSTVGAGLPAKAPGQSTSMLNVRPLSLASQRLQGIFVRPEIFAKHGIGERRRPIVGAGLPAMAVGRPRQGMCQARHLCTTPIAVTQSLAHTLICRCSPRTESHPPFCPPSFHAPV